MHTYERTPHRPIQIETVHININQNRRRKKKREQKHDEWHRKNSWNNNLPEIIMVVYYEHDTE